VSLFDAFVRGEPPHPRSRNFVAKTRDLGAAHSKDFVILLCTALIQITSVTDRQTDWRTDKQTLRQWLKRAKHSAIARNKHRTQKSVSGYLGQLPQGPIDKAVKDFSNKATGGWCCCLELVVNTSNIRRDNGILAFDHYLTVLFQRCY